MTHFEDNAADLVQDERLMEVAIREARRAEADGEIPVGAIVVHEGRIIGRGHNQREQLNDPTAHAEMIALTAAAAELGSWRLLDCTLYVTLEPCTMCAGALVLARIPRVVFGTPDPKAGACGSLFDLHNDERLNHRYAVSSGVRQAQCAELLVDFFQRKRAQQRTPRQ